jgi:hypothetical protein
VRVATPTTVEQCRALKAWAEAEPIRQTIAASREQIETHLEYLSTTLPSQAVDDESGKKRFAVYVSLLSHFSNEALQFMSREACRTLDWFPTPKQCLALAAKYRPPVSDRDVALSLCSDFTQAQFDRWLANVEAGQEVGEVPEQWLRIATERGPIRRLSNGRFVSRARYHGPVKQYGALVSQ